MAEKEYIWVELDMLKDGDTCTSMRGKIESNLLGQLIANTYEGHFFRMDMVHGVIVEEDDEKDVKTMHFRLYGHTGPFFPMQGHTYLRTQDIRELSPLKEDYEQIYETAKYQESIDF